MSKIKVMYQKSEYHIRVIDDVQFVKGLNFYDDHQ
jgi:hypothetical protein